MTATPSRSTDVKRALFRLGPAVMLAAWAVLNVSCETIIPRQGWSAKWGPLVSHKTFPGRCSICHVSEGWDVLREDFTFDHEKESGYALEGIHAQAACLRCHNDRGPVQYYVARGCGGCHVDPHQSTLGLDCARCHEQRTWRPGGLIAEHARTSFPLVGLHTIVPCESCHEQAPVGLFRGAPRMCELCHAKDLGRATSPDHAANGLTRGCEQCHTPLGWGSATFNHDFFPLIAGHSGLTCDQCHRGSDFRSASQECISCHESDYLQASDHVSQNRSRDCTQCHSIVAWEP